jgi:hypothetical protein
MDFSSWAIRELKADCDVCRAIAARVKLPYRATDANARNC